MTFRFRVLDIRTLDPAHHLWSADAGDRVMDPGDPAAALRQALEAIAKRNGKARDKALSQLMILSGLRRLEERVEREVNRIPESYPFLDHAVLGREYKKGLAAGEDRGGVKLLRRMLTRRFGALPLWAERKLRAAGKREVESWDLRLLDAAKLRDVFGE